MESREFYRHFVSEMDTIVKENKAIDGRKPGDIVRDLIVVEEKFKSTLISTKDGKAIYVDFMNFINKDEGNVLKCRPYFRERQETFNSIMPLFVKGSPAGLYKYRINYMFAKWVLDRYGNTNKKLKTHLLKKYFQEIKDIRQHICETNLPLVLNRVKIFWSQSPDMVVEYAELVDAAVEGILNAIDKFVPDDGIFPQVAIGRMILGMSDTTSQTLISMPPQAKRILKRANRAPGSCRTPKEVLKHVRQSFKGIKQSDIDDARNAKDGLIGIDIFCDEGLDLSEIDSPENNAELRDIKLKLAEALSSLSIFERKIIRLKYGI